jgi:ligand-binding SRPBCC domain-containing protein
MGVHELSRELVIDRPASEVFDFFASAENLAWVTPPKMGFEFRQPPPQHFSVGTEISYRVRLGGIPINWTSRITEWQPPWRFADTQVRGPYRLWNHTHVFDAIDDSHTVMRDRVEYAVPFGPLGEVARLLFVDRQLKAIFDYRAEAFSRALGG